MNRPTMVTVAAAGTVDQARVLRESVARRHPEWRSLLVLTGADERPADRHPGHVDGFDEVLPASVLAGPRWGGWVSQYSGSSLPLVLSFAAAELLLERPDAGPVVWLEPETLVLGDLSPVVDELAGSVTVLVPRLLEPAPAGGSTVEDELAVLRTGTFSAGLLAWSPAGLGVVRWFLERLDLADELAEPPAELAPGRLLDLLPAIFDDVAVLRDPGLAATDENLGSRVVSLSEDGEYLVAAAHPLRTLRFADPDGYGPTSSARIDPDNTHLVELWRYYLDLLRAARRPASSPD
jgi:hypothetical protein